MYIEISTGKNVIELISILENKTSIQIKSKIDSTNYGEGFEFSVNEITCRVSDSREYYEAEPLETYNLIFEIDRHDKFSKYEQETVSDLIVNILKESKVNFEIIEG